MGRPEVADDTLVAALAGGDGAALVVPDDDVTLTYDELAAAVAETAEGLRRLGVGAGDRVAFALPGGPEIIEVLLAVASLGAGGGAAQPGLRAVRVRLLPRGPAAAACSCCRAATSRRPGPRRATTCRWPTSSSAPGRRRRSRGRPASRRRARRRGPDDVALLLHTSGTTSRPKQVPLSHRNLLASARSIARHYAPRPRRRVVLRDAAVPRARHRRLDARAAGLRRHRRRPAARRARAASGPQLGKAGVTWYSASPTFHEMLLDGAPDEVPDGARLRFVALLQRRASGRPSPTAWRSTSACRCWRRTA